MVHGQVAGGAGTVSTYQDLGLACANGRVPGELRWAPPGAGAGESEDFIKEENVGVNVATEANLHATGKDGVTDSVTEAAEAEVVAEPQAASSTKGHPPRARLNGGGQQDSNRFGSGSKRQGGAQQIATVSIAEEGPGVVQHACQR